jgi:chemosensory pili system protein ChpA (sensor histidine kinase/response regulator)
LTVSSEPGQGTTFTLRVPMNLAVARALLVQAGGQTFAVPLASVLQVLRPDADDAASDQTNLQVVLTEAFDLPRSESEPNRRPPVLILDAGERSLALTVDRILGCREVVVKPLGNHLHRVYGVAGATLASDGSVILILNPADLLRPPTRQQPAPVAPLPARSCPLTVLVVDDSPSVRRVTSSLLLSAGWLAREARDGVEALEQFGAGHPPNLVLLDVEMPRMDGYETLAALKNDPQRRAVPVVMVTSRAGDKHRRKALDLGANGYVVKPYQEEELLALIRTLVRK